MLQGRYETVTMLRNGEQLILAVVLPLLAMVGLTVTPLLDGFGASRINVAVPGILALCAMSTAFTGQGISTGFDRRYGVLRFLSTTPLGRTGLIAGKVLAVLAVLSLQVLVVTAVALPLGWQPDPQGWAPALALLVLGAAAFTALGLLVGGHRPAGGDPGHHQPAVDPAGCPRRDRDPGRDGCPPCCSRSCSSFPPAPWDRRCGKRSCPARVNPVSVLVLLLWTAIAGGAATRWFKWN